MVQAFGQHRTRLAALAVLVADQGHARTDRAPAPKLIKTYDDYYLPDTLTVKVGTRVKFRSWSPFGGPNGTGGPGLTDLHDAVLIRPFPKAIKPRAFRSGQLPTTDLNWTVRFTKPGRYVFNCTNHHTEMRATVTVRR